MPAKKKIEKTEDGHHVVIDGRKWRATNPHLPEATRQKLVNELMAARRAVAAALKAKDKAAEAKARAEVHAAKVTLGERGPKWWEEPESNGQAAEQENAAKEKIGDKH
jgi:hypothetical protein